MAPVTNIIAPFLDFTEYIKDGIEYLRYWYRPVGRWLTSSFTSLITEDIGDTPVAAVLLSKAYRLPAETHLSPKPQDFSSAYS